jgi:hypothetical protein
VDDASPVHHAESGAASLVEVKSDLHPTLRDAPVLAGIAVAGATAVQHSCQEPNSAAVGGFFYLFDSAAFYSLARLLL